MTASPSLSGLDAAFLYLEGDGTPMHMGSIGIFEGAPLLEADGALRIEDLRRLISSRLHLVPKLRQQPTVGLLGEAPPTWEDDPSFDIRNHVRSEWLEAPGDEDQLLDLCAEVLAAPLNPSRPLWELTFVTGFEGNKVAVIEKLHHSMADGIAAAELAMILLDLSPVADPPSGDNTWAPGAPPSGAGVARRDLIRLAAVPFGVASWLGHSVLHPLRSTGTFIRAARSLGALWPSRLIGPSSSLNAPIGPRREVHFVRMELNAIKKTARCHGATVNDVVLALVAGGLHHLLDARGELERTPELQVLVPVGLQRGDGRGIGNGVSALFVRLPVQREDPAVALASIAATTAAHKRDHEDLAPAMGLALLDPLPQSVLAAGSKLIRRQPFFNLIVTNVPGPDVPLYALGARMLEAFPIVPLAGNQGLGVAALSYDGHLTLGVLSDPEMCPDVQVFCDGATQTLRRLSGTKVLTPSEILP